MPPWHIDRSIGEYLDDPSLSDDEDRHDRRVGGRRRAARAARPMLRRRDRSPPTSEWTYGEPDLIVRMAKGFNDSRARPRLHS